MSMGQYLCHCTVETHMFYYIFKGDHALHDLFVDKIHWLGTCWKQNTTTCATIYVSSVDTSTFLSIDWHC